ncbi:MAG TPA: zinc dependent phospholipase C family protein [Terriglobales bacterium]|nr:zinc dependent phospholipase C family protein [Terriglobales bacterium]
MCGDGSFASHYASDIAGHPAVNQAVAIEYPKLQAKFGKSVRYAQDKTAHLKTEFGFDTVQVARNRYASQQYHDFIGFQVSKSLLERVFPVVYGVELKDVLTHEDVGMNRRRVDKIRVLKPIGPLKGLAFNNPTPQTEDLYIKSINTTVDQYRAFLEQMRTDSLRLSERKFERTPVELRDEERPGPLAGSSDVAGSVEVRRAGCG